MINSLKPHDRVPAELAREALVVFAESVGIASPKHCPPVLTVGDDWIDDGLGGLGDESSIVLRDPEGSGLHVKLKAGEDGIGTFYVYSANVKPCRLGTSAEWTLEEAREVAHIAESVSILCHCSPATVRNAAATLEGKLAEYERLDRVVALGLAIGSQESLSHATAFLENPRSVA